EHVPGMLYDVLIDRRRRRDEERCRQILAPAGAPHLLPRRRHGPRIAEQNGRLERADVDAELEGVRRNDATDGAIAQALLDRAPLRRQIAAAIAADEVLRPLRLGETRAKVREQQLGLDARPGERDGLYARREKRRRDIASGEERALADAERLVHDGWVHKGEHLLASGRAIAIDDHD